MNNDVTRVRAVDGRQEAFEGKAFRYSWWRMRYKTEGEKTGFLYNDTQ